jgi:hypothetical protein
MINTTYQSVSRLVKDRPKDWLKSWLKDVAWGALLKDRLKS